jgi:hypothetical protein
VLNYIIGEREREERGGRVGAACDYKNSLAKFSIEAKFEPSE